MSKKILIADDEPELVQLLSTRLHVHGFEVVSAGDGVETIQKVYSEKPDLIILDIMMPAGDGYSVCEKLKSQPETSQIPIVFLTAKSLERDERKGYSLGAEYYVKKPFDAEELIQLIKKILEAPAAVRKEVEKSKVWQVLLITDNIDVLQMLKPKLEEENFLYQIAQNKEELIEKLDLFQPQLVVFDLYGKNYEGWEFLGQLKGIAEVKALPFVILASPGDKSKIEELERIVSVIDIVENPYDFRELIQAIKKGL